MIPKEFETISEYVCKQTRWTDGSIRHDRMEDVVRCKDCIVFGTHGKNTDICPMWHNTHIDPYRDFCSRGVRKTENSSEKPNNSTCSKMEQVEDEQIASKLTDVGNPTVSAVASTMEQLKSKLKDEPPKWQAKPDIEKPTVNTTCINVMASRLEYEAEYPMCETCRYDEPNNPICDECIVGEDKPSNYKPDFWHSATKDDWLKAHGLK